METENSSRLLLPYGVLVHGENYLLNLGGQTPKLVAFYTWRCVEATAPAEAASAAIEILKQDDYLQTRLQNTPDNPPRMNVEEVREGYGDMTPPGTGFTFYTEEDEPVRGPFGWIKRLLSFRTRITRLDD